MSKEKKVAEYLQSEEGIANAKRFIKALKEGRIVCSIKRVSSSGMSRVIRVHEVVKPKGCKRFTMYQFNYFLGQIGYTYVDDLRGIRMSGCGMDMVFALLDGACETLKYHGFKLPGGYSVLADDYMLI